MRKLARVPASVASKNPTTLTASMAARLPQGPCRRMRKMKAKDKSRRARGTRPDLQPDPSVRGRSSADGRGEIAPTQRPWSRCESQFRKGIHRKAAAARVRRRRRRSWRGRVVAAAAPMELRATWRRSHLTPRVAALCSGLCAKHAWTRRPCSPWSFVGLCARPSAPPMRTTSCRPSSSCSRQSFGRSSPKSCWVRRPQPPVTATVAESSAASLSTSRMRPRRAALRRRS
mmetsp:Transcript_12286/g.35207  ORF Transcript_12286/g.35207 Transcript_12286/m.35207 type:complete len:230 (+) Transcript_12286:594-1283(+)